MVRPAGMGANNMMWSSSDTRGSGQGNATWGRGRRGFVRGGASRMLRGGSLGVNTRPSPYRIAKSFNRAKDLISRNNLFKDSMIAAGLSGVDSGTKLYISNLDRGVSNEDIKELFSEIGDLRHCAVHYDRNGRPNGSAEVVFTRRSDAVAAVKRYNNVQLDGKAMKIEIIGTNLGLPVSPRVNVIGGAGRGRRTVVMNPDLGPPSASSFGSESGWVRGTAQRGRGRGRTQVRGGGVARGRGRGRGWGFGRRLATTKSAEELDKELDNYHTDAMNTS